LRDPGINRSPIGYVAGHRDGPATVGFDLGGSTLGRGEVAIKYGHLRALKRKAPTCSATDATPAASDDDTFKIKSRHGSPDD
jgi:hypothetical protein